MRLTIPVPVRWADLDAYNHVNNVAMLRILEEARILAFWQHPTAGPGESIPTAVLGSGAGADTHTVVARQEIEYLRPLGYTRTPVDVQLWLGSIGGASIDVCYEVHDAGSTSAPYARALTTVVVIDAAQGTPRRLRAEEKVAWEPYLETPVSFRRR